MFVDRKHANTTTQGGAGGAPTPPARQQPSLGQRRRPVQRWTARLTIAALAALIGTAGSTGTAQANACLVNPDLCVHGGGGSKEPPSVQAPSALVVTDLTATSVRLSWVDSDPHILSYIVQVIQASGPTITQSIPAGGSTLGVSLTGLQPNSWDNLKVTAMPASNAFNFAEAELYYVLTAPTAPSVTKVMFQWWKTDQGSDFETQDVQWTSPARGAAGYIVQLQQGPGAPWQQVGITDGNQTRWSQSPSAITSNARSTWCWRVLASNATSTAPSNPYCTEVYPAPQPPPPSPSPSPTAPTNLVVTGTTTHSATIGWAGTSADVSYRIQSVDLQSLAFTDNTVLGGRTGTFTDVVDLLQPGHRYQITVTANGADGRSSTSVYVVVKVPTNIPPPGPVATIDAVDLYNCGGQPLWAWTFDRATGGSYQAEGNVPALKANPCGSAYDNPSLSVPLPANHVYDVLVTTNDADPCHGGQVIWSERAFGGGATRQPVTL